MQAGDVNYLLGQVGWMHKSTEVCAREVREQVKVLDLERLGPWGDLFYQELLLTSVQGQDKWNFKVEKTMRAEDP